MVRQRGLREPTAGTGHAAHRATTGKPQREEHNEKIRTGGFMVSKCSEKFFIEKCLASFKKT